MTNEPAEPQPRPVWLSAAADDFSITDVNRPVAEIGTVDCWDASTAFAKAATAEGEKQNSAGQRVYAMLGAVCSFYFKPEDSNEPFGPMSQMGHARSAQPDCG